MRKLIIMAILIIAILPVISASTDLIFTQNKEVDLKVSCLDTNNSYCLASTMCQITIHYPNMTNLIDDENMTYHPTFWNYTLNENQTTALGEYPTAVRCEGANNSAAFSSFSFLITENGRPEPAGIIVVIFSILFFIVAFLLLSSLFLTISDVGYREFRLRDVIFPIITYLGVVIYYYLCTIFFPKEIVLNILNMVMKVGVWTHVFIPLISLLIILLLDWNKYKAEQEDSDGYQGVPIDTDMRFVGERPREVKYKFDPHTGFK